MRQFLHVFNLFFIGFAVSFCFATTAKAQTDQTSTATISTDQQDYPPGSTVIISGSGFKAFEDVTLQIKHDEADSMGTDPQYHQPWTVTTNADGNVSSTWTVPSDGDALGATF